MIEQQVMAGLYVLASLCVVYKLAYLIRQTASLTGVMVPLIRIAAVVAGTVIIYRTVSISQGESSVGAFDIVTQVCWCVVLYTAIVMLGRRRQVW